MQRLEVSGAVRPICGSLGVKRLMSCPRILGISQLHNNFLCRLLTAYSNLKGFWSNDLPSVSGVFLHGPPLGVLRRTARTRDVCNTLSLHSNAYGRLRTARNWGLANALPYLPQMSCLTYRKCFALLTAITRTG